MTQTMKISHCNFCLILTLSFRAKPSAVEKSNKTIHISAIAREKQIKKWSREKKVKLIDSQNPNWKDLSEDWYE